MSVQNTSKEEQQQYKKKKEWNAIKNCIPLINECLQLNIDPETYDVTILFSALTRMFPKPTFAP
mgnify:CR=1 FL=1